MLSNKLNLRIGVKSYNRKVFIPRFVGASVYSNNGDAPYTRLLEKHEFVIRRCLSRIFYIEETFILKEDDGFESLRHDKRLVAIGSGPIERRLRRLVDSCGQVYYHVYFYVPIIRENGRAYGYTQIRNVESLFSRLVQIYPDIKLVDDI